MAILKRVKRVLALAALTLACAAPAHALLVTYTGSNGLSGSADFSLLNSGNQLQIVLTNTSTSPFGNVNGSADMVLSSINFNLGAIDITGGSVSLPPTSGAVVSTNGSTWTSNGASYDLNEEYGYANNGIGNSGGSLTPQLLLATNAVTSHSNGGNSVTNFNGDVGGVGNGLNWGLVPLGSSDIGNNREFIQPTITILLNLSGALTDLGFLSQGSYIEFGSDYSYVPNNSVIPNDPVIPEPATLALIGLGLGVSGMVRRRRR